MDKNGVEELRKDIASLAGQAPVVVKAKMSVSNFKLRQGMPVGIKVTLRGNHMWDFLLRLIAIALPNIRDFRGVPTKLDGQGNYTLGIIDHSIFLKSMLSVKELTLVWIFQSLLRLILMMRGLNFLNYLECPSANIQMIKPLQHNLNLSWQKNQ